MSNKIATQHMKLEDFNNSLSAFKYHKTLPIIVSNYNRRLPVTWYKAYSDGNIQDIKELKDRSIESVSEEEINLFLLKYSGL